MASSVEVLSLENYGFKDDYPAGIAYAFNQGWLKEEGNLIRLTIMHPNASRQDSVQSPVFTLKGSVSV
jgi:hypothetical protein